MPTPSDVVITCGHLGVPLQCMRSSPSKPSASSSATSLIAAARVIVITYLGSIISGIGIHGGLLCLVIFCSNQLAVPTTHYLLIANSLIDFVYLSLEVVIHYPNFIIGNRNGTYFSSYVSLGILRTAIMLAQLLRNWIIVCLGLERYLLVCHPVYFRTQWKLKHIHLMMSVVVSFCILLRVPYVLAYIFDIWGPDWCNLSKIMTSIHTIFDVIFLALIPVPLLATLAFVIIHESNRLQKWRMKMTSKSTANQAQAKNTNRRAHQAIMVGIISFTLCTGAFLPNGVLRLMQSTGVGDLCTVYFYRQITAALVFLGSLVNSTINPFIYLIFWARFRKVVWKSVCRWLPCLLKVSDFLRRRTRSAYSSRASSIYSLSRISRSGRTSGFELTVPVSIDN